MGCMALMMQKLLAGQQQQLHSSKQQSCEFMHTRPSLHVAQPMYLNPWSRFVDGCWCHDRVHVGRSSGPGVPQAALRWQLMMASCLPRSPFRMV
jgi:hypothetical protein